ncbi:MAG: site-specific DNA-methyltransferase [Lachnospiraceae bacterium]|nr:site-specific DNA-methyltransferase [Lachnospiraceae bacterium]
MSNLEKMRMESLNMTLDNISKIEAIFPNCITEAKDENGNPKKVVNFDILRQMLSEDILEGDEAYEFTWVGKKAAIVEANKPIRKTLRPCKEESVDWDTTENLYIEGDNLEVLKLLQESYLGKVKMIYIDPPYNTGNDFIYNDDFKMNSDDYKDKSGEINEYDERLFKNSDSNGRFHSDWCSMIYSRLLLARNLLREDGVIFISIDDNEVDNLKKICNEVYGSQNFVANAIWQSTPGSNTGDDIKTVTENILIYSKNRVICKFGTIAITDNEKYSNRDSHYEKRGGYVLNKLDRRMTGNHYSEALNYSITLPDGSVIFPGGGSSRQEHWNWRWSKSKVEWGLKNDFILIKNNAVYFKQYEKVDNEDKPIKRSLPYQNLLNIDGANSAAGTREVMNLLGSKYFDYPKPLNLLLYLLKMANLKDGDIILDFFSGSATTAHAVMLMNTIEKDACKYILIQLPEKTDMKSEAYKNGYINICEIGKERIRRAGAKIKEENPIGTQDLDIGFRVLKLDDSNMNDVYYGVKDYDQGMLSMLESNIKEGRTDLDLLFGCLLEWGLPLSLPHTTENINGFTIHNYNDGDLIACFDEDISDDIIKEIAKKQPLRVVFRDSSFPNSPSKINVSEIFKMLAPRTSVKVI